MNNELCFTAIRLDGFNAFLLKISVDYRWNIL